jgi:cell wall-associated NlpC family hydrolase
LEHANILQVNNMLKNYVLIPAIACLATSCSTFRPATKPGASASVTTTQSDGNVQFINNIVITPDNREDRTNSSISPVPVSVSKAKTVGYGDRATTIESFPALQFKFAILENCSVEELNNAKLLSFLDYWYGAPYRYGGTSRDGIDCSAFAFLLLSSVYGVASLPRTSKEQYASCEHISRDRLREGDLVFFHTLSGKKHRGVTHVGVYLRNNKFVHASVSGVMISDMNEGYYESHFVGAGRVPDAGSSLASGQ